MQFRHLLKVWYVVFLLLLLVHPVWSQESAGTAKKKKSSGTRLSLRLSDQDIILPITSIEWGTPDRWSITSRYIHMFDKERTRKTWYHNLSVSVSPGISGGRLGIGYQNIFSPKSLPNFGIFSEARVVLLRTWGNPLSTLPNRTFIGAEIRGSLSFLINLGIGYYTQIATSNSDQEQFYGFHIGMGI